MLKLCATKRAQSGLASQSLSCLLCRHLRLCSGLALADAAALNPFRRETTRHPSQKIHMANDSVEDRAMHSVVWTSQVL
eukprot:scaffold2191_cov254-Pinguiococcus_pyrenoidosus.AAC.9